MVAKTAFLLILPLCLLSMLMPADVAAQDSVLGQLYGSGVHAYFAGDYVDAHEHLTSAIDGGSRDPRAYYFRALVYQKLGRDTEAGRDLEMGSKLEMQGANLSSVVSKSLVRVQGPVRRDLETYRTRARLAMHQMQNRMRSERSTTVVAEPSVIGDEPAKRDESLGEGPPADAEVFNTEPPAGDEPEEPIDEPDAAPSPFDDPIPTEPPAGNGAPDPFGGDAPEPFGGDAEPAAPAEAPDPIGGDAEPAPGGAPDPFSGGPPAVGGDQARGPSKSIKDGLKRAIRDALLGGGDKKGPPKAAPTPKAGGADPEDPFGAPPATAPNADKPAAPPEDPFGEPPAKAPKADKPPAPKKTPPPAPKQAPPSDDPFG